LHIAPVAGRYRWRTKGRELLPFFLIGLLPKGRADGGDHEWYGADDTVQRCYHCAAGVRPYR
jgi:hypothetical protein